MIRTLTQYGVFTLFGAAVILLLSFVVEEGIKQVDEMLIPCQHGTSFVQGRCRCDGTPFNGTYCSNCMCEHGVCSTDPTTPFSNSDYGCRCPTQSKRFGFLCDLCNTVDENCTGDCKPDFFGTRCERICYADLSYDNNNEVCNTMRSSGGFCSTCHGHGTCQDGFCECDDNWFDDGRNQCVKTCPGTPTCSGHGACKLYGDTPGCQCEPGWNGPECNIPCPGILSTGVICNDNGVCNVDFDAETATCECAEKFRGPECEIECPGDVVSCNGHGTCDDLGVCTCQTNVQWSLPSCKCSDELTCNARGTCNSEEKCECFGNFAGDHCLECKLHWFGEDCDMYCDPFLKANTSDRVEAQFGCFGHGTCLERSTGMECMCNLDTVKRINDKGAINDYVSYYDPEYNCGECLEDYFPKQAVVNQYGMPSEYKVPCEGNCNPASCNNRGVCNHNFGVPGESLCSCTANHLDDASYCTECEANWYPLDFGRSDSEICNSFCIASGSLPAECDGSIDCVQCNGHGTCSDEGNCLCEDGYTGDMCQIHCTSSNGKICGGHGTCESNEIQQLMEHEFRAEGGIPLFSCTCDPQDPIDADSRIDWDEKLALGLVNGTLDPPPDPQYFGKTCDYHCERPPWKDSDECNGLGNCTVFPISVNNRVVTCTEDTECQTTSILNELSGSARWSPKKGPFCHKLDELTGCEKSTDDCYEILLKQRPIKMRSEDCVANQPQCLQAINNTDWHQYCIDVEARIQPALFQQCKSVASFCPAKQIPSSCKAMVDLTDGTDVSKKLDMAYEFDRRQYPFEMIEEYRADRGKALHDDAEAAFRNAPEIMFKIDSSFCSHFAMRYPNITSVRENKQYVCNGVISNNTNCSGTLADSENNFYLPFEVDCPNGVKSFISYEEALAAREPECTISELQKDHVYIESDGRSLIDSVCTHIDNQFPTCKYPTPCDFNPCSDASYTCTNEGSKAICTTTGNLNSTCLKGVSERLSFSSYSCDINITDTECTVNATFETNRAQHCMDHNPIVSHVDSIGNSEVRAFNGAKYIHFMFRATDTISTATRLEFGNSIIIYIRQGQMQINEVQFLQSCPITDPQCNNVWGYDIGKWYHIELEINATHVKMTRKDTNRYIIKELLSTNPITQVKTIPGSALAYFKNIVSENDIPSPFSCTYETCNLDVSYRTICSDIIRNVQYPSLLEPQHNVLQVCSNLHERTRIGIDREYSIMENIY